MASNAYGKPAGERSRLKMMINEKLARMWVGRGEALLAGGSLDQAVEAARKALAYSDTDRKAHLLLARAAMPGDDYLTILARLHERLKPETYVEIGVSTGKSLTLASADTRAIGIDPMPRIKEKIDSRATLYPIPSDTFFDRYDLFEELGARKLSLAFIDGLHLADQVLRDFINIERYANRDTVILIHDCLPLTRLVAARDRRSDFWCGDVWKIMPCLKSYRPDLTIHRIAARPSGLAMITNPDPASTVLADRLDEITKVLLGMELDYDFLDGDSKSAMSAIPGDWEQVSRLLLVS